MSIINDALKKAARQRAQEENDLGTLMPGSHRAQSFQGKKKNSTQTIVLVAAAAIVLIVVSVVVTGILVTGKPPATPLAAEKPAPTPTPVAAPAATVVEVPTVALVTVPKAISAYPTPVTVSLERPAIAVLPTPVPTAAPTAIPTAVPTAVPTAAPTAVPTELPTPAALVTLHPPTPAPPVATTPGDQAHNDLVQGLIDRLQVSGVRAAGAASKALVDGHVYRINDVLDRPTGLKLVGVDEDHLTFVDNRGVTYVKNF